MGSGSKVVFLIDTITEQDNAESLIQLSNSICLSCLRLLLFFSSEAEKGGKTKKSRVSQTGVKWGYKFFSSKSVRTKIEFHKFLEFKLKYFEEFENEVQRRFDTNVNIVSTVKPAISLSKALTELLSDFPWEGPDISSPVKGRRNPRILKGKNYVYLFSACPRSAAQLKTFSGKRVPDADVFLDSFLPSSLYQEFCFTSKLSLNWIDTSGLCRINSKQTSDLAVQIVESAVSKAGGHVSPLDGIVQNGSPCYVDISSLMSESDSSDAESKEIVQFSKKDNSDHSHIIPLSTTLNHLQNSPSNFSVPKYEAVLKFGGLEMCLDLQIATKAIEHSSFHEPLAEEMNLKTTSKHDIDTTRDFIPSVFRVYSLLENSASNRLLPERCYIGAEAERILYDKNNTEKVFRKLISSLASRSCSMVLVCENTGQLALLEPLTIHTACISLLSKRNSLSLEKVLLQSREEMLGKLESDSTGKTSVDHLVNKLLAGKKYKADNGLMEPRGSEAHMIDGKQLDRWHIPGPRSTFKSLIKKLNLRINELEFLTKDETSVLKKLQKAYKNEKKPPGVRDSTLVTTEKGVADEKKVDENFELPYKGKKSRTSITRAEMILSKSKEVAKVRDCGEINVKEKSKDKTGRDKPEVVTQIADFKNIEELKEYMMSIYEKATSGETTSVDTNVQTTVTVALHFLKQTGVDNPEEECSKVLNDCLVLPATLLREKYLNGTDIPTEQKLVEYQFQIVLRLEMLSTLVSKDQTLGEEETNDEVVGLLRTLSFMCEPGALSKFMETCLLYNYMHTIPKTLTNIYDELMQPLPDALSNILSPNNSSADQSVFNISQISYDGGPPSTRTRSHGSVGPPSGQPGSNKSLNLDTSNTRLRAGRKLAHHPSLADFGAKRQIVVEKVQKQKEKSSRKRRRSGRQGKEKVAKSLFDKGRGGMKLERRQSVAVMQRTQKTPKKAQVKLSFKSPVNNGTRRPSLVAETPQHKQLAQSLCQHKDVTDLLNSTDIVEESPEKAYKDGMKDTPTKGKRAKALMRRSFYSAGPIKRTRNLTQYFQLADRIAGRQRHPSNQAQTKLPKLLSLESENQLKSPDKNSSFLLSQFAFSPSPRKFTPKKLNKTPSKLVTESPSQNTRSRHRSGCFKFSNQLGVLESPKHELKPMPGSPSVRLLQSPISRRQSPCILVEDSAMKNKDESSNKTPEKSSICGSISNGLDSPCHSTQLKVSATPTRRSVRAALFSKSPAPLKMSSPRSCNASPQALLSRFGSPNKQCQSAKLSSPRQQPPGVQDVRNLNKCLIIDQINEMREEQLDKKSQREHKSKNSTPHQKTPSPDPKKVKTPDSFDKWHRRKPRYYPSPAQLKSASNNVCSQPSEVSNPQNCSLGTRSPLRKKRTLILSPERPLESPSKRRRTSRLDSTSSLGKGPLLNSTMANDGSQGFDVNSPLLSSQVSCASSLDYFSAANDEVFLSKSQTDSHSQPLRECEDMEVADIENGYRLRMGSKENNGSLLKDKTLDRICSSDFQCSGDERSESPIFFNSARKSRRNRNISGDQKLSSIKNVDLDSNFSPGGSASRSPNFGRSPGDKKFSPNVSAKSLMHLMNSPLLGSSSKGETKSKRSLRLQN